MLTTSSPMIIGPTDGEAVSLQTIGVRFMIPGADSDARFSLVEHPIPPRALAAPHAHPGRSGGAPGDALVASARRA